MEIIGYFCAMLIGISLGVLGSGGSILTVPLMVYLMHINPVDATGYSLFVVGITSATGGITYWRKKLVDFKSMLVFALPSIVAVFLMRKYFVPAIPNTIFTISNFVVTKELMIMILFAILMIIVSYNMISKTNRTAAEVKEMQQYSYPRLIGIGLICGILTGLLGVGGGFIIIPALVLYANVSVRMSVGTSLFIIAFNSFVGFLEEAVERHTTMNYHFLLLFTLLAVAGIFIGFKVSLILNSSQLKKLFGWFILLMGIGIIIKEIFLQRAIL